MARQNVTIFDMDTAVDSKSIATEVRKKYKLPTERIHFGTYRVSERENTDTQRDRFVDDLIQCEYRARIMAKSIRSLSVGSSTVAMYEIFVID